MTYVNEPETVPGGEAAAAKMRRYRARRHLSDVVEQNSR